MAGYENRVSMKARNNFIGVCLLQARRKSINPQSLTLQGFSAPLSTMWSPHKPQHQLKPIQYCRRNMFFSLWQNLCLFECSRAGPPSTLVARNHHGRQRKWVQGRRQGGARGVRDEGKVERWICLRVTFRREERRGTILWSWRRRWPCWTVVGLIFIKHNIFHKRLHGHCWIHHWQRNLRVSKWCAEGEFRCCSNIKIDPNPIIPHLFPEHGKREHGFVGLDLLRPLLADRSLLLCRAGLHDQEVRWNWFLVSGV